MHNTGLGVRAFLDENLALKDNVNISFRVDYFVSENRLSRVAFQR